MAIARSHSVDLSVTPYYHCVSRCVRQAYLCGKDARSGADYEHRRGWVRDRLRFLAGVFAVDVLAYAVMSNHLHAVVRVDVGRAEAWSEAEVVERYGMLFRGAPGMLEQSGDAPRRAELVARWRGRLMDVSWLMRTLNEYIARKANKEDGAKGRFWEGRFRSQAILDEQGLLTCMAYVDLNPVRAKLAQTLEASDFTSIQERLFEAAKCTRQGKAQGAPVGLAAFAGQRPAFRSGGGAGISQAHDGVEDEPRVPDPLAQAGWSVPQEFSGYVELLMWTGRALAPGKRGALEGPVPELLRRHRIGVAGWLAALGELGVGSAAFLGSAPALEARADALGRRWVRGVGLARRMAA